MARPPTRGTPKRAQGYLMPRRDVVLRAGLAAALALVVGGLVAHWAHAPAALSPGRLSFRHAALDGRCQACHASSAAEEIRRCEACHDPTAEGRFVLAAHTRRFDRPDGASPPVASADASACGRCHVEHAGREARLERSEAASCARCHFAGFDRHPELAPLRGAPRAAAGLNFAHDTHLSRLASRRGLHGVQACVACHEPKASGAEFEPISFARHCASCHLKDGALGTVARAPLDPAARPAPAPVAVGHAEPWLVARVAELRLALDPEGARRARASVQAQLGEAERERAALVPAATEDPLPAELRRRRAVALEARSSALRARLQAMPEPPAAPLAPAARDQDEAALRVLMVPCLRCHVGAFADAAPARPQLVRAGFTHRPHVTLATCLRCHAHAETSSVARDFNVAGIETCRSCHGAAGAPADCRTCHLYHPPADDADARAGR